MALPLPVSFRLTSNTSTDITGAIDPLTVDCLQVLTKEVSTLKFEVKIKPSRYAPAVGQQIDMYETTSLSGVSTEAHVFGGTITEINTVIKGGVQLVSQVTCTDWGYKMNGRLVVKSYTNQDPADIVADIIANYCPAGFNASTYVQRAGYNIASIKFNYEQPTKCIQALASNIGWNWYVDPNKNVHFFLAENNTAPFAIDDTSGAINWTTLQVDVNLQNMKNSVFVIGGIYKKLFSQSNEVDVYKTDGTQFSFPLVYAYAEGGLFVLLNGTSQSIGMANQVTNESAYQTIYDRANKILRFVTPPSSGQTVEVYGTAEIPIIGHSLDQGAINSYGEFQDAIFDAQIKSISEAQQRAQAEILQFGHSVYDVKFTTNTAGLRIGQNIIFNSGIFGVSNYPLVVKRIEARGRTPNALQYDVECIGSDQVTFVDIMSTLLQKENANSTVADDNTTLEVLIPLSESSRGVDVLAAPTAATKPYLVGTTDVMGFFTMG